MVQWLAFSTPAPRRTVRVSPWSLVDMHTTFPTSEGYQTGYINGDSEGRFYSLLLKSTHPEETTSKLQPGLRSTASAASVLQRQQFERENEPWVSLRVTHLDTSCGLPHRMLVIQLLSTHSFYGTGTAPKLVGGSVAVW